MLVPIVCDCLCAAKANNVVEKVIHFCYYLYLFLVPIYCYFACKFTSELNFSELKKLSEESLARPPEEVFDIIFKLGEGSYGSVFKAIHKESGSVSASENVV